MTEPACCHAMLVLPWLAALVAPLLGRSSSRGRILAMTVDADGAVAHCLAVRRVRRRQQRDAARRRRAVDALAGRAPEFAVDGYNVYFLLLTALLFPAVLACAWQTAKAAVRCTWACCCHWRPGLLGTFLAQDMLVFFVAWEAVLIPMVLLILVFGGAQRRRAAMTFFLYTMAGSVLLLAAVIWLGAEAARQTGAWTFDLRRPAGPAAHARASRLFVFVAVGLACAVKSPLFPFHAWLPLAYGEASPSGTALMAGVLSKMGAYRLHPLRRAAVPRRRAAAGTPADAAGGGQHRLRRRARAAPAELQDARGLRLARATWVTSCSACSACRRRACTARWCRC